MDFSFTKQLSVGNRIIDSAHKKIFDMLDRVECLIGANDHHALSETFNLLEDYLADCFLMEEYIAQAVNFPFDRHALAHQHLLNKVQSIKNELASFNGVYPDTAADHYPKLLRDCFIRHIKYESGPMRIILNTQIYDLVPGCKEAKIKAVLRLYSTFWL
ncbi:MAG: hemerythrin family protein [Gallionella sp.]|nr:hemerythrin family protein [Gallionella sp.]